MGGRRQQRGGGAPAHELRAVLRGLEAAAAARRWGGGAEELRGEVGRLAAAGRTHEALAAQEALVGGLLCAGGRVGAVEPPDWAVLVQLLNSSALQHVGRGQKLLGAHAARADDGELHLAGQQLRAAEVLCLSERLLPNACERLGLLSLTCTNLSVLNRTLGRLRTALRFSRAALRSDERAGLNTTVSHLNVCATLDALELHQEALRHARQAVSALPPVLANAAAESPKPGTPGSMSVRSAAHFNLGAQQMALGKVDKAVDSMRAALEVPRPVCSVFRAAVP